VPSYTLLIGLLAAPILGIAFTALLAGFDRWPRLASLSWLPAALGAGVALLAAGLLLNREFETVIAHWGPVSFTGVPLALAGWSPGAGIMVAWTAAVLMHMLMLGNRPMQHNPTAQALLVATLALVAFSGNLVTLLIGLGLTDIFNVYYALRRRDNPRNALIQFTLNGLSSALLFVAITVHTAAGNGLTFPLVKLNPTATNVLALAVLLRLGAAPFRASHAWLPSMATAGSAVAGLLVLARLPELGIPVLPLFFDALLVLSALLTLGMGALSGQPGDVRASIITGTLYLAAASIAAMPDSSAGVIATAAIAWILGSALISLEDTSDGRLGRRAGVLIRSIGALVLIGMPLTVGLHGRAGIVSAWQADGLAGALLIVGFTLAGGLLAYCLVHCVLRQDQETDETLGRRDEVRQPYFLRASVAAVALALPALLFGLAPSLVGAGDLLAPIARMGILDWLVWLLSLGIGFALWQWEPRWAGWIDPRSEWLSATLSLRWFTGLFAGATGRIRAPFTALFDILESDGALVWAAIIALLAILVSRPGGP
jgi:hypothetical protein